MSTCYSSSISVLWPQVVSILHVDNMIVEFLRKQLRDFGTSCASNFLEPAEISADEVNANIVCDLSEKAGSP